MKNFIPAKSQNLKDLAYAIYSQIYSHKKPVFMCVGTDKVVADSLAPIVAEILRKKYTINAFVYGGINHNINATNLIECYNYITTIHSESHIVLVDAGLGDNVGCVSVGSGAYAGLGKNLPNIKFGNTSILGIVGSSSRDFNLHTVKLKQILDMAEFISKSIAMAMSLMPKS